MNFRSKFTHRLKFELERFFHEVRRTRLESQVAEEFLRTIQELYESTRFLSLLEQSTDDLKHIYQSYKQIQLAEVFKNPVVAEDPNLEVFGLPLQLTVQMTGEIYSLVHMLRSQQYNDFLEQQYYFQMNLMSKISAYLKKTFYYK